MLYPREPDANKFNPFITLFPNFGNTDSVLDYGGNRGNLLYFSNNVINPYLYTCIDVDPTVIEHGKIEFPNSNWIFFNKFNWCYNHNGIDLEYPNIDINQNYIWAYSVFTHTDFKEFKTAVLWFLTFNFKKIAISFLDIDNIKLKESFYEKRIKRFGSSADLPNANGNIVYFIDNTTLIYNQETAQRENCKEFLTFYKSSWLVEQFSKLGIDAKIEKDVAQHSFLTINKQ
jgi:hypothetical protein